MTAITCFLKKNGFHLINKSNSINDFGNHSAIFSNDKIEIRFVQDRSINYIDIKNIHSEKWYDLPLIITLSNNDNITEVISVENQVDFLIKHLQDIILLFDKNQEVTINKLEKLLNNRVEKMFPSLE